MSEKRTIVLTGASDGIGAASARQLRAKGHDVVVVGRSPEKTRRVAEDIGVTGHVADFADLEQVRGLAAKLLANHPRIDVLANNAGGTFARETTADGFDRTLQVNHLAPFLLTSLLRDRLLESGASVIQTSSRAHLLSGALDRDHLGPQGSWSATKAYGAAKLANALFTVELHRRFHAQGLRAVAFHPGVIRTNFASDTSSVMRLIYRSPLSRLLTSVETGGSRLTWLADGTADRTWRSGAYYVDNREAPVNPVVRDATAAARVWDRSEELLGL
ncbi:SDR family NAD(P)-dependent oxidoreductase [Knoellia sp. CPCC 206450]|uniref:SDR family NAD(P)-dependent oxidoreductase n=1 Tax=Knoellia tibetensis TaxID=3404798 RepID=UPI003B42CD4A